MESCSGLIAGWNIICFPILPLSLIFCYSRTSIVSKKQHLFARKDKKKQAVKNIGKSIVKVEFMSEKKYSIH